MFRSDEGLYFTDPPFGLPLKEKDPEKELSFNGVYRLSRDGRLTVIAKDLTFPNGIAFSPAEETLYVSVSDPAHAVIWKYKVQTDGTLRSPTLFYDMTGMTKRFMGLPDGMKVDREGNVFATGPGGIYILSKSGKLLGRIDPGQTVANCAWGGDGSTLYITASTELARVRTLTRPAAWK